MPARRTRRGSAHPYLLTLLIVALATCLQWLIWPLIQLGPFILYYPAVVVAALYGSAPLAVVLCSLLAQFLFFEPAFSLAIRWPAVVLQILFLISGALIGLLARRMRSSLQRAQVAEAELSTTLLSIGDAVIATGLRGEVVFMNPVAEAATGWRATEARGRPLSEVFQIINEVSRTRIESPVERVLREGVIVGLANHTALIRRDGSEIVIEDSAAPIRDQAGKLTGVVLVFRDASQTKLAQRRLEESEERLRKAAAESNQRRAQLEAVFQSVSEGIVVFDAAGNAILVNEAEARICGYASAEEMKRDLAYFAQVFELSLPDGSPLPVGEWPVSRALRGESLRDLELRGRRTDTGQEWLFSFTASPVRAEAGGQVLAVVITRDITEQNRARKALEDSEARFRSLANSIPQLAWMADPEGSVYWYNQRWYDYTGSTLDEARGWGWEKVHHPDHVQRVVGFLREAWRKGEPWELTFPLRSRSGEWRWFLTRAVPIRDLNGKLVQWFGTNTDVTGQLEIQEALEKIERDLRDAVTARDEFLSIASHELKTPLTSLKLQSQMRARSLRSGDSAAFSVERLKKMVESDSRQIERITRLIDDMLDISRITTGRLTIERERFDLCALVQEVVDRYMPDFNAAGCKVSLVCCDPVIGDWDRFRIEQVATNLLTNALKYGSGHPVEVSVSRRGSRATLAVRDRGIGIAKDAQERIFRRFERAISASEISGLGLGLGLYIARQIVEMHGGEISVESEPGKGSTFTVELPLPEAGA